jgi:membrane-associated phospholipid phosphatase
MSTASETPPGRLALAQRAITRARALTAALLVLFVSLAMLVRDPVPNGLDVAITRAIQSVHALERPMAWISVPGNGLIPHALTTFTVLLLAATKRGLAAAFLALTAGVGAFVNTGLKHVIGRPRPTALYVNKLDLVGGLSFPSGHVAFYVCYFGFLGALAFRHVEDVRARRALVALAAMPIALIPFSRVYLGAHWASDTLGALLWSSTWLALGVTLYDVTRARRTSANEGAPA